MPLTTDYTRFQQPYAPAPRRPKLWQGERLYQATVGGVGITVHAPDKAEALIKIMAIALEHKLATL